MQYRKQMKRREIDGMARFLTFSCFQRLPLFGNDKIKSRFAERLAIWSQECHISVLAWVIMPEHVHLVVFDSVGNSISGPLNRLKAPFARQVINRWRKLDASVLTKLGAADGFRFWQVGGGYDRNVIAGECAQKIQYCHANPVRRGLALGSCDWEWSSARAYENRGDYVGPRIAFEFVPSIGESFT